MKTVNFKIDDESKRQFEQVMSRLGLSSTSAYTIFTKKVIDTGGIPFPVTLSKLKVSKNVYLDNIENDEILSTEELRLNSGNSFSHHIVYKK